MKAYLNGQFLALTEARISPLDRGFLYADGVYEVIPVYARVPFRLDQHLIRLQASLDGIRLSNPHTHDQWRLIIERLIADTEHDEQTIYLQVTRGADTQRDPCFPVGIAPTVFLFSRQRIAPREAQRQTGVAAITAPDMRWARCDLKTVSLLANVLLRQLSADADCAETILLRDGFLTEGSSSNVFIVKNGEILAPPKDHQILPGVTYDLVLELAQKHALRHSVRPISAAELRSADEIWITSSAKEVLAVITLDGLSIGHGEWCGKPGPITRQMHAYFVQFRDHLLKQNNV